ncbi:hypothetical protein M885DRAFT_624103 [Pelagophyceae sp. CCMP2097]|nr:hypothetical protein M885DRAFT_624103 [Pelagophyceae sp. CCMP2097]|mmetsp:Transcript_21939/g.75401  ORF Transcript_21939/g.75401 Transcript_21939/m.75401 type:complete len:105 (-) Transcript_21939:34-348(-)
MRLALVLCCVCAPAAALRVGGGAARPRAVWRSVAENENEVLEILAPAAPPAGAAEAAADDEGEDDVFQKARVLTYMGISLLPIIALIPFMSQRDFAPLDPSQFT